MKQYELGIIGLGKMGSSILKGVLNSWLYPQEEVFLYDVEEKTLKEFEHQHFSCAKNEKEILSQSKKVILSIKPQSFPIFFDHVKNVEFSATIISIAAGISLSYLEEALGSHPMVRVMPNTPALIQKAATAMARNDQVDDKTFEEVKTIFLKLGTVEEIDESQMDIVVPVNGSMPAYLYLFAKSFIDQAVIDGMDEEVAKRLTCKAIMGSCEMILESNRPITSLIQDVCSPNGTTLAGLEVLQKNHFETIIHEASKACTRRSIELGKNQKH